MSRANAVLLITAVCILTVLRIAATHAVFSPTYDEPLHVAAGYEFVAEQRYRTGTDNPPLARAVFAFPLRHARPAVEGDERIQQIFDSAGDTMRGVVLARRGNLLFVVIAILGTALWASYRMGRVAGVVAAFVFAMLPAVLAHGGLATTDVAGTAGVALAMFALSCWLDEPSWRCTLLFGAAVAFLFLTKFTFVLFFAAGAIALMAVRRRWPVRRGVVAAIAALAIIYSFYLYAHAAPRFLIGLLDVIRYSLSGHEAYLLGEVRRTGWWYYFPLVLSIKTPLPVLLLSAAGIGFAIVKRQHIEIVLITAAMLAAAMISKGNLGVRHVLPVYVPLSMLAAFGMVTLWQSRGRLLAPALATWLVVDSAIAHPDYLPWMNAVAGKHPERIVVDSNLDWGQDVLRLRDVCRLKRIAEIGVELFGRNDLRRLGLPRTRPIDVRHPAPGWYAISESIVIPAQARDPRAYAWLTEDRAFERVGRSIRLYYVPSEKSQRDFVPLSRLGAFASLR